MQFAHHFVYAGAFVMLALAIVACPEKVVWITIAIVCSYAIVFFVYGCFNTRVLRESRDTRYGQWQK